MATFNHFNFFFCIGISPEAVFLLSAAQPLHRIRGQRDSQLKEEEKKSKESQFPYESSGVSNLRLT